MVLTQSASIAMKLEMRRHYKERGIFLQRKQRKRSNYIHMATLITGEHTFDRMCFVCKWLYY